MSNEHMPSIELALSLASPFPLSRESDDEGADAPSALPEPLTNERHETLEEGLGPVTELCQRYPAGADVSVQVHWLLDPRVEQAPRKHLRYVEVSVDGERLRLRRGQIDSMRSALEMAEYLFETQEREELGRRTC